MKKILQSNDKNQENSRSLTTTVRLFICLLFAKKKIANENHKICSSKNNLRVSYSEVSSSSCVVVVYCLTQYTKENITAVNSSNRCQGAPNNC